MKSSNKSSQSSGIISCSQQNVIIRRRKCSSQRRRDGLLARIANKNVTSQGGEDGIIERIFQLLPPPSSSSSSSSSSENSIRYCVDVGAWDGVHLSNSHSLLVPSCNNTDQRCRWRGILIEAHPERFIDLQRLHEPLGNVCVQEHVSCMAELSSTRGLSSILRRHASQINLPSDFDFLSIDVDGYDYWLLNDILTSTYHPKVICIEFNPTMPNDLIYIQPQKDELRHGSSLSALVELASSHKYVLVETTMYNAFFVTEPLYQEFILQDLPWCVSEHRQPTIEELHEVTMGTHLYQLYDGTIKLSGCKKLLWHRVPIEEDKIQILEKKEQRSFPFAPPRSMSLYSDGVGSTHAACMGVTTSSPHDDNTVPHDEALDEYIPRLQIIKEMAVDMTPYRLSRFNEENNLHQQQRNGCAKKLIQQLQQYGFIFIHGTGISQSTCQHALHQTKIFLQSAPENVRRSCLSTKDRARRGYSPQNTENFASLLGVKGPNDLVRKFRIGPATERSTSTAASALQEPADAPPLSPSSLSPLHSENIWPDPKVWGEDNVTTFRTVIEAYYDQVCSVSHQIVKIICDGLVLLEEEERRGDDENCINAVNIANSMLTGTAHTSILTLLGYRRGARHQGRRSRPLVAAHTDVGVITMLLFDQGNTAILQRTSQPSERQAVKDGGGEWVDVMLPPLCDDPYFVINIGDCLSDLCGKVLPSTLHRVMPEEGSMPRNCLAMFVGLEPSTELTFPSGETMSYEEWRKCRVARASNVLKMEDKKDDQNGTVNVASQIINSSKNASYNSNYSK